MGAKSKIEWTDATWTPIRAKNRCTGKVGWFCTHASPGCVNCYAETMNARLGTGVAFQAQNRDQVEVWLDEGMLRAPLRWRKPRLIFVNSMTDTFGEFVSDEMIDRIWAIMALSPEHTFIVLTKRSGRMREYLSNSAVWSRIINAVILEGGSGAGLQFNVMPWPLPNVWLGVSIEDPRRGEERGSNLAMTPAAVRLWSVEPLLDDLGDLTKLGLFDTTFGGAKAVDWVIVGGESGREARPMHPAWARSVRDQCAKAGVAFFFKQWGEWIPGKDAFARGIVPIEQRHPFGLAQPAMARVGKRRAGRLLDGREHSDRPELTR